MCLSIIAMLLSTYLPVIENINIILKLSAQFQTNKHGS